MLDCLIFKPWAHKLIGMVSIAGLRVTLKIHFSKGERRHICCMSRLARAHNTQSFSGSYYKPCECLFNLLHIMTSKRFKEMTFQITDNSTVEVNNKKLVKFGHCWPLVWVGELVWIPSRKSQWCGKRFQVMTSACITLTSLWARWRLKSPA